jgi:hypothetical protein
LLPSPGLCGSVSIDGTKNEKAGAETNPAGCRNYDAESERKQTVEEFYRVNHISQTYEFVSRIRAEYGRLDKTEMGIWDCIELLNEFIDDSDPDLDMPQIEHLLQTAEAIRKDYPDEDWLHLTGLIHGTVLLLAWLCLLLIQLRVVAETWAHAFLTLTTRLIDCHFQTWARCCCTQALGSSLSGLSLVSK